eukprot:CAMPEP_0198206696 /NCGR_PEP_ID=MMETSP1445-20131203/10231_1 /TAXON_ID=36898 /ORGANISM="Pyramimonas sp., Strain CCMP2087" /LENGTH=134 /DNA_ID=CAMNT_0043879479 /DNA_START=443 /DNA_END=848 /DNA_ORIENTATION=-
MVPPRNEPLQEHPLEELNGGGAPSDTDKGAKAPRGDAKNQAAASLRRVAPASAHRGGVKHFMRFEGVKRRQREGCTKAAQSANLFVLLTPTFAEGGEGGTTVPIAPLFAREISTCLQIHLVYNYVQTTNAKQQL